MAALFRDHSMVELEVPHLGLWRAFVCCAYTKRGNLSTFYHSVCIWNLCRHCHFCFCGISSHLHRSYDRRDLPCRLRSFLPQPSSALAIDTTRLVAEHSLVDSSLHSCFGPCFADFVPRSQQHPCREHRLRIVQLATAGRRLELGTGLAGCFAWAFVSLVKSSWPTGAGCRWGIAPLVPERRCQNCCWTSSYSSIL